MADEPEHQSEREEQGDAGAERPISALRRARDRLALTPPRLRALDVLRQPVVLGPGSVRLILLLILGNLAILILMAGMLYQLSTAPRATPRSILVPVLITPTPAFSSPPSPVLAPTPTPFGSGGAIAFTLRRNGNTDIYAFNQADRQLLRLTHDLADDRDPAWSPDGNYIAFASNRADNWDIYLLDLLSGALIRLTHDAAFDSHPAWSPDGKWIAFESYRRGNLDIYRMSTTGEQLQLLTLDDAPNYGPVWSPDGRAIAYVTFNNGNKDIYVRQLDEPGKGAVNVTQSQGVDEDHPVWSPDGSKLAYVSGPRGNPALQIAAFNWETMAADPSQTELFGAGTSPAWSPDGQSLIYVYARGGRSHIVAAHLIGWALFHEVYSVDGPLDGLAWHEAPLSPRVLARALTESPTAEPPFYVELVQPTPTAGPPYKLVQLPNVVVIVRETPAPPLLGVTPTTRTVTGTVEPTANPPPTPGPGAVERERAFLSDRVNESFNFLRQRVIEEAGWDYLAQLSAAHLPMTYTPYLGHSRMTWYVCGRAIGLDREPYNEDPPRIELVREDIGNMTYWRVFIRAQEQDGRMGEPLHEGVWDLNAQQQDSRLLADGGRLKETIPAGYYVDFTTLAADYGWERVPSMWRWRYYWPDVLWWRFQKTDGMSWWACMQELFEQKEIEAAFGPIPTSEIPPPR